MVKVIFQAIAKYHSGDFIGAKSSLTEAKSEFKDLDASEESIQEVVAQGFTESEARLALRARSGNVAEAVVFAEVRRADMERVEREEAERRRKRSKYGHTAEGNRVNLGYMRSLQSMGFSEDYSLAALKQTDNDVDKAAELIQTNPDLLDAAIDSMIRDDDDGKDSDSEERSIETTSEAKKARKEKKEALRRFEADLVQDGAEVDSHLSMTLEHEAGLLEKYSKIMRMM